MEICEKWGEGPQGPRKARLFGGLGTPGLGGVEAALVSRGQSTGSVPPKEPAWNLNSCSPGKSSCHSNLGNSEVQFFVTLQETSITLG